MVTHQDTVERSNAGGHRCINKVLVNVVTKGQGGAILPTEGTNRQKLKKKRKCYQQGVNPVV